MAMKQPTKDQIGLKKLPEPVRNKMGYMKNGGKVTSFKNGGCVMTKTNQSPKLY